MNEIKLVVFDLAGTTVHDTGQVVTAFTSALAEHGLEITAGQVSQVRGASKRQAILHFIPEGPHQTEQAAVVYATFRRHLTQLYQTEGVQSVTGASEVFQWLRSKGVAVALTTGFDRDITSLLLTALGWETGVADAIVCGDDVRQGRPAPYLIFHAMEATGVRSVRQVATVGDTVLDLQAGYNAGVGWNIGVLSGAHSRQVLEQEPHTRLLPSVKELPSLWK
ncbi:MAG: phosphonatase-like hydrolase [Blastocatellia bacterium]|nr:phosphonatase-like hydrolase [Blastocatellia bacterium]